MIVKNVTVKQLVEFRRYSAIRRQNFANQITIPPSTKLKGDGGDYWISALSAIANTYKENNQQLISDKIDQLDESYQKAPITQKIRYQRNLEILQDYVQFDLSNWRPAKITAYLKKPNIILNLNNVPIRINPHHIFTFDDQGAVKTGGIWFVYWQDGFNDTDLGMYTEAMFHYLNFIYGKEFRISPEFCLTVDVLRQTAINYEQLLTGQVASVLNETLNDLQQLI
ncbi:hypothetical protein AAFN85_26015 [Mucilaginibacter sp. CAU 1740]|uniref:hypothetical protein n=1 Tax=Mucilaginibacter sp. CAU 1740 TaxID=3140365 RepID=UPI00325B9808